LPRAKVAVIGVENVGEREFRAVGKPLRERRPLGVARQKRLQHVNGSEFRPRRER
jgi:hypothetical protein